MIIGNRFHAWMKSSKYLISQFINNKYIYHSNVLHCTFFSARTKEILKVFIYLPRSLLVVCDPIGWADDAGGSSVMSCKLNSLRMSWMADNSLMPKFWSLQWKTTIDAAMNNKKNVVCYTISWVFTRFGWLQWRRPQTLIIISIMNTNIRFFFVYFEISLFNGVNFGRHSLILGDPRTTIHTNWACHSS